MLSIFMGVTQPKYSDFSPSDLTSLGESAAL